jgi:hypothetical protein
MKLLLDAPAAEMEQLYFPQEDWIIDAIHERILPLPGLLAGNGTNHRGFAQKEQARGVADMNVP